ncbi:MAG: transposase [Isosphaeraceae bacterium]|nr:transposase [Isosphaeraceae bacterium]
MGRPPRAAEGALNSRALNRANARRTLFEESGDDVGFMRVLAEALAYHLTRLLAYCVMPTPFHLVLRPRTDGKLSDFMRWLTLTHAPRWHAHRRSAGTGHLHQGRFKAFPVERDQHFQTLCRYVKRNALRAGLVRASIVAMYQLCIGRGIDKTLTQPLMVITIHHYTSSLFQIVPISCLAIAIVGNDADRVNRPDLVRGRMGLSSLRRSKMELTSAGTGALPARSKRLVRSTSRR